MRENLLLDDLSKLYVAKSEEKFIMMLILSNLDKSKNININLDAEIEIFHRKVYEKIQLLHSDKIAQELINYYGSNENFAIKKVKTSKNKPEKNISNSKFFEDKDHNKSKKERKLKLEIDLLTVYNSQYTNPLNDSSIAVINEMKKEIFIEAKHFIQDEKSSQNLKLLYQNENLDKKNKNLEHLILSNKICSTQKDTKEPFITGICMVITDDSVPAKSDDSFNLIRKETDIQQIDNLIIIEKKLNDINIGISDHKLNIENENKNEEIYQSDVKYDKTLKKKKKKHRDLKKKIKNKSKDNLPKLDKFHPSLPYSIQFSNPNSTTKFNPHSKPENEEKKQAHNITKEILIDNTLQIMDTEIKLSLMPPNDSNLTPNGSIESHPKENMIMNKRVNSPLPIYQTNENNKEILNSPLPTNQENLSNNEKMKSPFMNSFYETSNSENLIIKSPIPIEDSLNINDHPHCYPNINSNPNSDNNSKFKSKYYNLYAAELDKNHSSNMINQLSNPKENNPYMYMNTKVFPVMTPNIGFNYNIPNNHYTNFSYSHENNNIVFNKFNLEKRIFFMKLHNDILDYSNNVNEIIDSLKEIKIFLIQFVEMKVKEFLIVKCIL